MGGRKRRAVKGTERAKFVWVIGSEMITFRI
jgi:hypothetical protein